MTEASAGLHTDKQLQRDTRKCLAATSITCTYKLLQSLSPSFGKYFSDGLPMN